MRSFLIAALGVSLAAACQAQDAMEPELTAEEIASATSPDWRDVSPENLILVETAHGDIAIELNPDFAPNHAAQFRQLVRDDVYNGAYFYRVIEAFVAQGGLKDDEAIEPYPTLINENDRALSDAAFVPLGNADLFAPVVGHIDGFAVGRSETLEKEWLLHCPGALAMARDTDPDSGSTEFYIVLDAQRYLDRNLTVFGRVIDGMQYVQKLERGDRAVENGVIQAPATGDEILSMTVAADMAEAIRPRYQVQAVPSQAFEDAKTAKRVRDEDFFYRKPPEILDICGFEVPMQRVSDDP